MFSEATGVTEQEGQGRRLLFGVCTLGGRDVRKGPECCVISADLFALDITAYGKRPVAGSNQNNTSSGALEFLPLSVSAHSSREAEAEEEDIAQP